MWATSIINKYTSHQHVLGFSRRTIDRRRWSLTHWERHCRTRGNRIDGATVDDLESFLARFPAPQSRYSVRSDLRGFYKWANQRGYLTCDDPTDSLPPARVPTRAATPISADDVRRMLDVGDPLDRLLVMLGAYAGLRISEMSKLRGDDIDIDGRLLVVRNGKGGSDAVLPLADELAEELRRWPRHGRVVGIGASAVGDRIRRLIRRLGIVDARPHDLRHSFGTQAARRTNGNLVLVAKLMRHAQVQTTVRYVRWHTSGHEVVSGLYSDAA